MARSAAVPLRIPICCVLALFYLWVGLSHALVLRLGEVSLRPFIVLPCVSDAALTNVSIDVQAEGGCFRWAPVQNPEYISVAPLIVEADQCPPGTSGAVRMQVLP